MSAYFFCVVCVGNRSDTDRKYKRCDNVCKKYVVT